MAGDRQQQNARPSPGRNQPPRQAGRMPQTLHHGQQRSYWELWYTCSFMRRAVLTPPAALGYATSCLPVAGCSLRLSVHLFSSYLQGSLFFQEHVFIGASLGEPDVSLEQMGHPVVLQHLLLLAQKTSKRAPVSSCPPTSNVRRSKRG